MFIRAHGLSYHNDKNIVQTDCFVDIKTLFLKVYAWMDSVGRRKCDQQAGNQLNWTNIEIIVISTDSTLSLWMSTGLDRSTVSRFHYIH